MLPAAHRMRSAADFTETTRRGARAGRGRVVVHVLAGASGHDDAPALVGLTVGRSVGNSVARHRAARRLRALLVPLLPTLADGSRVVVRALPGAATDPALAGDLRVAVETAVARSARGA